MPRSAPSLLPPVQGFDLFRVLTAGWLAGHSARVRILHETAAHQLDLAIGNHVGPDSTVALLTEEDWNYLTENVPGFAIWHEVYQDTADNQLTREERRRIRARIVDQLREDGRTAWADLVNLLG